MTVQTDTNMPSYIGAHYESNQAAETSAIAWVVLFMLSNLHILRHKQIVIVSDSGWSIKMANEFNKGNTHSLMA